MFLFSLHSPCQKKRKNLICFFAKVFPQNFNIKLKTESFPKGKKAQYASNYMLYRHTL